jgi:hypothetical protein
MRRHWQPSGLPMKETENRIFRFPWLREVQDGLIRTFNQRFGGMNSMAIIIMMPIGTPTMNE